MSHDTDGAGTEERSMREFIDLVIRSRPARPRRRPMPDPHALDLEPGAVTAEPRTAQSRTPTVTPPPMPSGAPSAPAASGAAPSPTPAPKKPEPVIRIEGDLVHFVTPEGTALSMKFADVLKKLAPRRLDTRDCILPDGVRLLAPTRDGCVIVHETPPRIHALEWTTRRMRDEMMTSPGYREVRIALPYLVLVTVVRDGLGGLPCHTGWNEVFFRNAPITSIDDPLQAAALLNVCKMTRAGSPPIAWICTQNLDASRYDKITDPNRRLSACLKTVLHHLLESGFNHGTDNGDTMKSWFTRTVEARVDPRVSSIEAWEEATRHDPMFAIKVPWLPIDKTLRQVVQRIVEGPDFGPLFAPNAAMMARIVVNGQPPSPAAAKPPAPSAAAREAPAPREARGPATPSAGPTL